MTSWVDREIEPSDGPRKRYTEEERKAARKRSRLAVYAREKEARARNPLPRRAGVGIEQIITIVVPPEVIAEALYAHAWRGPRAIVAELQGDPLPGRSALDLMRAAHEGDHSRPDAAVPGARLG